jgi:hypothetical protein
MGVLHSSPTCHRLYFAATNLDGLSRVSQACPEGKTVVTDILCQENNPPEATFAALRTGGFSPKFIMRRIRNPRLPVFCRNERLQFANEDEANEVLNLLTTSLDPLNSHFPSKETIARFIREQSILVSRNKDGSLFGLSVFPVQGKVCNYNYLVNKGGDIADAMSLLFNTYAVLAERGITTAFAWVDQENLGVYKMHLRFGYKPDGVQDHIWIKL